MALPQSANDEPQRLLDELAVLRAQRERDQLRIRALEAELARAVPVAAADTRLAAFEELFRVEQSRAKRGRSALTVALLEVDDHAELTAHGGQAAAAAAHVAHVLAAAARPTDVIAALAERELALLLPATALDQALAALVRLQLVVTEHRFAAGTSSGLNLSFSAGIAQWRHDEPLEELMRRAAQALAAARQAGPNKLVVG